MHIILLSGNSNKPIKTNTQNNYYFFWIGGEGMSLTEDQKDRIRMHWHEKEQSDSSRRMDLRSDGYQKAQEVARFIRHAYPLCEIVLYGSLARDGWFDSHSDIDLYIRNWSDEFDYWKMLSDCQQIASPFMVSLATNRDALPSFLHQIELEGQVIA